MKRERRVNERIIEAVQTMRAEHPDYSIKKLAEETGYQRETVRIVIKLGMESLGFCLYCRQPNSVNNPCVHGHMEAFRVCLNQWAQDTSLPRSKLHLAPPGPIVKSTNRMTIFRPKEEFAADFELLAKRTLTFQDWLLFRDHFLFHRSDSRALARLVKLGCPLERNLLADRLIQIQVQVGRACRSVKPFPLFPLRGPTDAKDRNTVLAAGYFNQYGFMKSLGAGTGRRILPFPTDADHHGNQVSPKLWRSL